uniref:Dynactin subunit 4 n=1 Tax=Odontella aurita TaxID=265563 RepID=A0A7S4MWN0_9STRA|mmetsp:Transcript_35700/g.106545  ORF Transcript_35700/g.106545 Transcript_35700/m.106545 type:complete len:573 (+) Transcript_35700:62-1780(+)
MANVPPPSSRSADETEADAAVLYVDHAGHPAPLGLCYHATASRFLSSSIDDRSSPSTLTEIDSAYCPQCLAFHDAATASGSELRGRCPKGGCRLCPLCGAVCGVAILPEEDGDGTKHAIVYQCGYCQWTSNSCSVSAPVSVGEGGSVSKEDAAGATEALARALADRTEAVSGDANSVFAKLVAGWGERSRDEERRKRQPEESATSRRGVSAAGEGWGIDTLEEAIAEKKKDWLDVRQVIDGIALTKLGPEEDVVAEVTPRADGGGPRPTPAQASAQNAISPAIVSSISDLLPLPVPLRARKSRRCRRELAEGRTGILVKPKVNPLEGDSSLRSGHGQWWKKDSSAVHSVPRVSVLRHGTATAAGSRKLHALLLSVRNPTLNSVRIRLGPSSAPTGREGWVDPDELDDVLVDGIDGRRVSARWIGGNDDGCGGGGGEGDNGPSLPRPTETAELESVQDAFLEMGRGRGGASPEEVESWDAASVLAGNRDEIPFLRLIAAKEDKAWIELVVAEEGEGGSGSDTLAGASHVAASLSLMIEVGEGSWESSLVKRQPPEKEGEVDTVNFDLVVLWKS